MQRYVYSSTIMGEGHNDHGARVLVIPCASGTQELDSDDEVLIPYVRVTTPTWPPATANSLTDRKDAVPTRRFTCSGRCPLGDD
jgi:hypothetical protein